MASYELRASSFEQPGVTEVRFFPLTYGLNLCKFMAMPTPPPMPSPAEVDILAALWRLGAATVREVHEALGKDIGYTTTLKTMQLMTEKGLLKRSERFRSHVYEPSIPKEQTQKQIAANLLESVFENSARSMVMGALAAQPTSEEELAAIRKMLADFAKQKGRSR